MTEREKMIQGLPYNAGDPELMQARRRCKELCFAFNQTPPSQRDKQQALLRSLLVQADEKITSSQISGATTAATSTRDADFTSTTTASSWTARRSPLGRTC